MINQDIVEFHQECQVKHWLIIYALIESSKADIPVKVIDWWSLHKLASDGVALAAEELTSDIVLLRLERQKEALVRTIEAARKQGNILIEAAKKMVRYERCWGRGRSSDATEPQEGVNAAAAAAAATFAAECQRDDEAQGLRWRRLVDARRIAKGGAPSSVWRAAHWIYQATERITGSQRIIAHDKNREVKEIRLKQCIPRLILQCLYYNLYCYKYIGNPSDCAITTCDHIAN